MVTNMNIVYNNKNVYIDIIGDINLKSVLNKIILLNENYKVNKFIINLNDMFNVSDYKVNKLSRQLLDLNIKFLVE